MRNVKIFVFDKNGNYLKSLGKRGSGPGDFNIPAYFNILPSENIILNDAGNLRVCYWDLNGKYLNGYNYNKYRNKLKLDNRGSAYIEEYDYNADKLTDQLQFVVDTKTILRMNSSNNGCTIVGKFAGEKHRMSRTQNGRTMMVGPYNEFIWNISPDNLLVTGFADAYELSVYDLDGKLKYKFNRKFTPSLNPAYGERREPQYLAALNRFSLFDNNGNYWSAQDYGGLPEYYIYDIFSKDGIFLKKIYSKHQIRLIKGDNAYSIVYSKTDPVYIKAFKYSLKKREK